jgi:HAD superfamily hydrolase (TIGR01509 family)
VVEAVVFDLDGLLLDSEHAWAGAKERLTRERGGRWTDAATGDMLGMSSPEWAAYMRDELALPMTAEEINAEVVRLMVEGYERELPLLPGAPGAVERLAKRWPLGLASSSNREIIDHVLDRAGWTAAFTVTVSSEEVERGKPAPDVYAEALRRLAAPAEHAVGIEDSGPGIASAGAAGLAVIAIPNPDFPPPADGLAASGLVLGSLDELDPPAVERAARNRRETL